MKKLLCSLLLLMAIQWQAFIYAQSPDSWTRKASVGGGDGRTGAVGFSIGSKGYIGLGYVQFGPDPMSPGTNSADFWEYDPASDTWTQKANFAGGARYGAVGFSIGSKGYVGLGAYQNDFWEYNPATNAWTQKAALGTVNRSYATGFGLKGKGYAGLGWDSQYNGLRDWWEYNPVSDSWTQKSNYPGSTEYSPKGFAIGNLGYVNSPVYSSGMTAMPSDFYQYDPAADKWTKKTGTYSYAGGVGFSIGNRGYVGMGQENQYTDGLDSFINEYDPTTDTWTSVASYAGGGRTSAVAFSIGNKGYIGTGNTCGRCGASSSGFWEYTPNKETGLAFFRGINLNGPAISINGNVWAGKTASWYSLSGNTYTFQNQSVALSPATNASRAKMIRSSVWGDKFTVTVKDLPLGTYQLYLYVWEDNSSETYSISLNNKVVTMYTSGTAGKWSRLGPYQVNDTTAASIYLAGGAANLSGIEILSVRKYEHTTPATPTLLTAQALSTKKIQLTWQDNAYNETHYSVERYQLPDTTFTTLVSTLPAGTTQFSDTTAVANASYCYRVRALGYVSGSQPVLSAVSQKACTTTPATLTPPAAPSNLVVETKNNGSSRSDLLKWTDNATNETGFMIDRITYESSGLRRYTVSSPVDANTTSYTFYSYPAFINAYKVKASNDAGSSAYSNLVITQENLNTLPPAPAVELEATALSSSQIKLTWKDLTPNGNDLTEEHLFMQEDSIEVSRSTGTNGGYQLVAVLPANTTSFINSGLTASTTYCYWVRTKRGDKYAYSDTPTSCATTPAGTTIPAVPTNLAIQGEYTPANGISYENVSWIDNATNETGFILEITSWTANTPKVTRIDTIPANTTTYRHSVARSQRTCYKIRAYNSTGISAYANTECTFAPYLDVPPTQPTNTAATALSSHSIQLSWTDSSPNGNVYKEDGYIIAEQYFAVYRSESETGNFVKVGEVTANTTSYVDAGLLAGKIYCYKIIAGNEIGPVGAPTNFPAVCAATKIDVSTPVTTFYRAINLNGTAGTIDGQAWEGKTAPNYTTVNLWGSFEAQSVPLAPAVSEAAKASMIRSSVWGMSPEVRVSNVANGTYDVYLYVWEDNAAETYSISLEGQVVQANYNSGSAGSWKKLGPWRKTITDGTINVTSTGGAANFSGIEIWKVNTTIARASFEGDGGLALSAAIWPNPSTGDAVTVQIEGTVAGEKISLAFVDAVTGKTVARQEIIAESDGGIQTRLSGLRSLPSGLGFVHITTASGARLVQKVLIQR
jgi:hypothetical protein